MAAAGYVPPGEQLARFFASNAFLRALIGPIYGGRKTCCLQDILRRAMVRRFAAQRQWRWFIVRPTKEELDTYTIPAVHAWLPPGQAGEWDPKARRHRLLYRLEDRVERLLDLQFLAMDETADRRRLANGETTGVWLDDARHLSEAVVDDAIRIAGTWPPPIEGGPVWSGVICSSRMPSPGHWLISRSNDPGDLELYRQPGGRTAAAENLPALAAKQFSYEQQAKNRHVDWVRVNIDAELGVSASEAAEEATRQAARESFTRYIELTMPDIRPALHHQLLIDKLERVVRGEIKRLMIFLPPGSAKSTYASVLFPPWFMGRNPSASVICASHSKDLAERFGRRVRNIVGAPMFRDIFGFGLSGDSGAAGRWETARGGEYFAVGVDASVTGRRAHLGVIDDPVKGRAEADSATIRQHTWDWYKADFWTRLVPNAALLYIGTRWHDDDLAGRLLEEAKTGGEQWDVVSIPAVAIPGEDDPLGRQPGERLWPEWFTEEMFSIARRDARNWSALYQQTPTPDSGDYFRAEWIRWCDKVPHRDLLRTYGASDYAVKNEGGDFTVHGVVGVDQFDDIYVLDLWREQASSDRWVEALLDLMDGWKTLMWAEERGQIEKSLGPFITKRQLERRVYGYRRQFTSAHDKATRAQAIRGRCAMGKLYLPRQAPWAADLVAELLRFPAGKHDDQVDFLSLVGRMLDDLIPGSKAKAPVQTLADVYELPLCGATYDMVLQTGRGGRYGPQPGRLIN